MSAALSSGWSNGQAEGQICKLKLVKRQMYGRGKLDLLQARVIGAPLPGDVELMPLPPTIVDLVPEYRDYDYVVVNDEIVIVQPSTRQVVEVINTCGGEAMNVGGPQAMAGTRLNPRATP